MSTSSQFKLPEEDYIGGGVQQSVYLPEEVIIVNCPLCNSGDFSHIYTERGSLGIVKCKKCGLIYTSPRVKNAQENYFGDKDIFLEEGAMVFAGKAIHHRNRNYEYELRQIKKIKPNGRFLDIGTNMGFFLKKAKDMGYETYGVEPSPSLAAIATEKFGLNIKNAFFSKDDYPAEYFDVITLIDVFEHVVNPLEMLNNVKAVLKDDGIICIKVPNGNYNKLKLKLARLSGREKNHEIFNSYEHVVHYTISSMKKMLAAGGLKEKKVLIPIPINPPVWANLVGHYYQHKSPFILDYKRIIARKFFYVVGKIEKFMGINTYFSPDLMFLVGKKSE